MLQLTNGPWQHQILWPANVAVQCKLTDRYVHASLLQCAHAYMYDIVSGRAHGTVFVTVMALRLYNVMYMTLYVYT